MHDMDPYVYVRENKKKHISTLKTNVWVEEELNSAPVKDERETFPSLQTKFFLAGQWQDVIKDDDQHFWKSSFFLYWDEGSNITLMAVITNYHLYFSWYMV